MSQRTETISKSRASGNLRIGDHWNAITIIALSQSGPARALLRIVEKEPVVALRTLLESEAP